jgi:hypothetical protein
LQRNLGARIETDKQLVVVVRDIEFAKIDCSSRCVARGIFMNDSGGRPIAIFAVWLNRQGSGERLTGPKCSQQAYAQNVRIRILDSPRTALTDLDEALV